MFLETIKFWAFASLFSMYFQTAGKVFFFAALKTSLFPRILRRVKDFCQNTRTWNPFKKVRLTSIITDCRLRAGTLVACQMQGDSNLHKTYKGALGSCCTKTCSWKKCKLFSPPALRRLSKKQHWLKISDTSESLKIFCFVISRKSFSGQKDRVLYGSLILIPCNSITRAHQYTVAKKRFWSDLAAKTVHARLFQASPRGSLHTTFKDFWANYWDVQTRMAWLGTSLMSWTAFFAYCFSSFWLQFGLVCCLFLQLLYLERAL